MRGIQFKIELNGVHPPIWRRFQVPANLSLADLHEIIQVVMGWENAHLYEFQIDDRSFGPMDEDSPEEQEDAEEIKIDDFTFKEGDRLKYTYDFGDEWDHLLLVEKTLDKMPDHPVCLDGARNCPPEDCGGRWGYSGLLEVIANPEHDEYEDLIDWLGGSYDPEAFDKETINEQLEDF